MTCSFLQVSCKDWNYKAIHACYTVSQLNGENLLMSCPFELCLLVSREMWVLAIVLVGYGRNGSRLKVWEKVDWVICHSNCKHLYQKLLPEIRQFFEAKPEESVIVNPLLALSILWGIREKDQTVSVLTSLPGPLMPLKLAKWLR